MTRNVGAIRLNHPGVRCIGMMMRLLIALVLLDLTSCAMISRHQFLYPSRDWQARSGQLMYRTAKTTLIGEVLVRFSKTGEFELTFSKGPGVTLLVLRQNDSFAQMSGALARMGWSGPIERAPKQLRGWLQLRDKIIQAPDQKSIRHVAGRETFLLRL
jgi:hypothetical protein